MKRLLYKLLDLYKEILKDLEFFGYLDQNSAERIKLSLNKNGVLFGMYHAFRQIIEEDEDIEYRAKQFLELCDAEDIRFSTPKHCIPDNCDTIGEVRASLNETCEHLERLISACVLLKKTL